MRDVWSYWDNYAATKYGWSQMKITTIDKKLQAIFPFQEKYKIFQTKNFLLISKQW